MGGRACPATTATIRRIRTHANRTREIIIVATTDSAEQKTRSRCIRFDRTGGPEVLVLGERALSDPAPGEVRIRVTAAGLNRADLLQRMGRYPTPPGFDESIPGLEYAGVVEATGPDCFLRSIGDPVMGIVGGEGYSERLHVPERETIRVPADMPLLEAGAIPEAYLTAWDALERKAGLRSGETVLIHAVGSGVGTAALQLARSVGARTVGTSRTPEKVGRALALGLDVGLVAGDHASDDTTWSERVLAEVGPVDVILDLVGASYLAGNQAVLGRHARWMVVGVPGGRKAEIDLRTLMSRRARIEGTVLRARPPEEKALLAREFERVVVPRFERGLLQPVVGKVFPAEEAPEAHRLMEANRNWGKILLRWD